MRRQPALVVPDQLFGGQPAGALHIAALDLADIQRRVQGTPHIMDDIGAQDTVFAGQGVDNHLGHGGAIGKIIERATAALDAIPLDVGCCIKPG